MFYFSVVHIVRGASEPYHRLVEKARKAKEEAANGGQESSAYQMKQMNDRNEEDDQGLDEVKFETSGHEEDTSGEDMSKAIEVSVDLLKNTPLLWAAHKGKLGVIWHLLEDGYSPNDVDKMDNNALHLAAAQGDLKILKVLIDDGVVANVVNHYKNHPIDMSKTKEVRDMIAVAMEAGASMTEKDIAEKHEKNLKQVRNVVAFIYHSSCGKRNLLKLCDLIMIVEHCTLSLVHFSCVRNFREFFLSFALLQQILLI